MDTNSARYGITYRHLYGEGCPLGPRYLTASEKRTRAGKPVCPRCRGELVSVSVTFALVAWRADGHYRLSDAIVTYARESQADADASERYAADSASPYVVRAFREVYA